jgi:hypothetical protein
MRIGFDKATCKSAHTARITAKKKLLICSPKIANLTECAVRVQKFFLKKVSEQFAN